MKPQLVTCVIKDILSQCSSDDEFKIAMHCIIEFMLITNFSVEEMISCIEDASGYCVESDRCVDDMIAELKDNYI